MKTEYEHWIRQAAHNHELVEERLIQFSRMPENDPSAPGEVIATTEEKTAVRMIRALREMQDGYLYRVSATFNHVTFVLPAVEDRLQCKI